MLTGVIFNRKHKKKLTRMGGRRKKNKKQIRVEFLFNGVDGVMAEMKAKLMNINVNI